MRCGTRLMLIVEPPAARFEDTGGVVSHEEHLLERISALENRLMRLTGKLEQTLDLLLKQAKNTYYDHALIDSLIRALSESGIVDEEKLHREWRERCKHDFPEKSEGAQAAEEVDVSAGAKEAGDDSVEAGALTPDRKPV